MEMLCIFDRILYATCTTDSNKKYSERKFEISPIQQCSPRGHNNLYRYRDRRAEKTDHLFQSVTYWVI